MDRQTEILVRSEIKQLTGTNVNSWSDRSFGHRLREDLLRSIDRPYVWSKHTLT